MKKKNIDCRGMLLVFLAAAILIFAHCSPAAAVEAIVLAMSVRPSAPVRAPGKYNANK